MLKNTNWVASLQYQPVSLLCVLCVLCYVCYVPSPDTLGTNTRHHWTHTCTRAITNSCCPSLEPHPFRSKEHSTASGAPDESTLATALPGTGDPRTALQPREPCRPFGRLAMTDGMGRLSGAPPLNLGWVRRGARPRGVARTHARGLRRWRRAKRLDTERWPLGRARRAGTGYAMRGSPIAIRLMPFTQISSRQRESRRPSRFLPVWK